MRWPLNRGSGSIMILSSSSSLSVGDMGGVIGSPEVSILEFFLTGGVRGAGRVLSPGTGREAERKAVWG